MLMVSVFHAKLAEGFMSSNFFVFFARKWIDVDDFCFLRKARRGIYEL